MTKQAIIKIKNKLWEYGHNTNELDKIVSMGHIVICRGTVASVFDMTGKEVDIFDIDYTYKEEYRERLFLEIK